MSGRHLLILTRYPGQDATLQIDEDRVRIVRLKVTPDRTEILYDDGAACDTITRASQ